MRSKPGLTQDANLSAKPPVQNLERGLRRGACWDFMLVFSYTGRKYSTRVELNPGDLCQSYAYVEGGRRPSKLGIKTLQSKFSPSW
jgi:hypothetical protein